MLICECNLTGVSDLMFGKPVSEKKRDEETNEQHEHRTWKHKLNITKDGQLFIQPFAMKNALESAAKWLNRKIPGEARATYTKRFRSGVMVVDKMLLLDAAGKPLTIDAVDPQELFVPSKGIRGTGTRVTRIFPTVYEWQTAAIVHVFDTKITADIVKDHIIAAGKFVGFGSMRVENGGINGRFSVNDFTGSNTGQEAA